jgi:heptosyltransferase-2
MNLVVRLPNWIGDVCMALPALQALDAAGARLHLIGKRWAADLLSAHHWPVTPMPKSLMASAALLRSLPTDSLSNGVLPNDSLSKSALPTHSSRRGLLLTNSLSSAAAFRFAGIAALGHRGDGRSLLLGRSLPRPTGLHEVEVFWRLAWKAADWIGLPALPSQVPALLGLQLTPEHQASALAALRQAGIQGPPNRFIVLGPLSVGTTGGQSKRWSGFAELASQLSDRGIATLTCPGSGEEAQAMAAAPSAIALPGLGLGAYAALCRLASLTVANDSGPMHLAAAVDAPVIGIFGPSSPARTRPWGAQSTWLGGDGVWPDLATVMAQVDRRMLRSDSGET